jgi:hypothetical protein
MSSSQPAAARHRHWFRLSSYVATGLVLALSVATPTQAASETTRDPGHDVRSAPMNTDALPERPEPARRLGDIVRTTVSLGTDLVITTKLRSLAAVGHQELSWTVVTSADEEPGGWSGSLVYNGTRRGYFTFLDPIANDPECARADVDRARRKVTLTVPSACLGDPDWVRVGSGTLTLAGGRVYQDDAHRDGVVRHRWKLGPKVTAG